MSDDPHLLARIEERVSHIDGSLSKLEETLDEFVRRHEFRPIQLAVFGMIGLIMSAIITAIVASVISVSK